MANIAPADLALIMTWHRYEACHDTLRIVSECCQSTEELAGLNAMLLSADPSGKEGRPGSWPVMMKPPAAAKLEPSEVPTEKFTIKSVDHFEFTPDGQYIVAANRSLIRSFDSSDGMEVSTLTKAKGFFAFAISPDSKHVVATLDSTNAVTISELHTGIEVIRKRSKHPTLVSWTHAGILVAAMDADRLLDPKGLTPIEDQEILSALEEGASFHFSPDHKFLANVSAQQGTLLIRTWPKLGHVAEWSIFGVREADSWQWSPDGRFILAGSDTKTIYEAKSGKAIWKLEGTAFGPATYSPDGKWVVTGAHSGGKVTIWDITKQSKVREFSIKAGWCFGLHISNDGRLLGAATQRQCVFWEFPELVS